MLFLSFLIKQKQKSGFQQVGGLVTKNISVFCLERVVLQRLQQNSIDFYKGIFLFVIPVCIIVACCTSTTKTFNQIFSSHIGTFIQRHVDCNAGRLHIIRLKRKNNTKKKTVSSFQENSFDFRILMHLCKCSVFHFLVQIYCMETVS